MRSVAVAVAALSILATAVEDTPGYAGVENLCEFDVYTWYVGGNSSEMKVNPAKAGYVGERYMVDPESGGRVIKMTTEKDGLFNASPQVNVAYTLDGSQVWYDVSEIFGSPFEGHELSLINDDENCGSKEWKDGVISGENNVDVCSSTSSFTLRLCTENLNE